MVEIHPDHKPVFTPSYPVETRGHSSSQHTAVATGLSSAADNSRAGAVRCRVTPSEDKDAEEGIRGESGDGKDQARPSAGRGHSETSRGESGFRTAITREASSLGGTL